MSWVIALNGKTPWMDANAWAFIAGASRFLHVALRNRNVLLPADSLTAPCWPTFVRVSSGLNYVEFAVATGAVVMYARRVNEQNKTGGKTDVETQV